MRVANLQVATGVIVAGLMASACDRQNPVEPDGPLFHEVQPQHDVSTQAFVSITQVTFDRFGGLSASGGPQIAVSITCDATGIIGDLAIDVEQRGLSANTNLDLLDAACTTVPTRYVLQLDCFDDCPFFQPGRLDVIHATDTGGNEFGAGEKIILRKEPLL